jgi:hypothetical protein
LDIAAISDKNHVRIAGDALMTKRDVLRYIAPTFALVTAIGASWYLFFVPYALRIAVAPAHSEPAQFLAALARTLEREKAPVRLTVTFYPDNLQTAAIVN